jgi:hypothetical protein
MTSTEPPINTDRTRPKVQIGERTVRMSGRVRIAVEAMVWQGLTRKEAAQVAGLKDESLYAAFRKPDTRALYTAECEVLRLSGRARRIHRLEAVVEQDVNKMATVNAALALERLGDADTARSNTAQTAGVTIRIINQTTVAPPLVDVTPARSIPAVPQCVLDAQRPPGIDHEPLPAKADPTIFRPRREW